MPEIGAIVVTYHPDESVLENISALLGQVELLIIVDNAATAASRELLGRIHPRRETEIIFNAENRGIATALNQGVDRRRAGWLILEARGVVLDHAQGRWERRRLWGRRPRVNDYDAVRRYYQTRNRLVLYRELGGYDLRWTLDDAQGYGWDFLKLLLFG